jgi:hypothetical protein
MIKLLSAMTFVVALMPSFALAKTSDQTTDLFDCAKALSKTETAAKKICGVIRIVGPNGPVTGFGPIYYSAEQRGEELRRAQAQCVSGFYAVAEDGLGC